MTTVRLVNYSKPTEEFEKEGINDVQDLIAFCARVSNPSAQVNSETSAKLIKYLIKHQHWSPLEMVNAVLEINTTRDIAHQVVRHRSFAFQEFSQRYANPAEFGDQFVTREARLQDTKNRQNSVEIDSEEDIHFAWAAKQQEVIDKAKEDDKLVNDMLNENVENEEDANNNYIEDVRYPNAKTVMSWHLEF